MIDVAMTRHRSRRPRTPPSTELAALRATLEQQRELLERARTREAQLERSLRQARRELSALRERADQTEAEAASAYARSIEAEARLARADVRREHAVADVEEQLLDEREQGAMEVASLRDALLAALTRERAFRHVEAELRRRLAELSSQAVTASASVAQDSVERSHVT